MDAIPLPTISTAGSQERGFDTRRVSGGIWGARLTQRTMGGGGGVHMGGFID